MNHGLCRGRGGDGLRRHGPPFKRGWVFEAARARCYNCLEARTQFAVVRLFRAKIRRSAAKIMFDNLQEKLQRAFKNLRGQGTLTEENIQEVLKEIRMALLESDVNFNVVKKLLD